MRNITITFNLKDEHEERLKRITEEYNKKYEHDMTEEEMFDSIMCLGSWNDIDKKLERYEWQLGLREDYK